MIRMTIVNVPIDLSDSFADELALLITERVMKNFDLIINGNELPPYPTKKQVKQISRIGEERINCWIVEGLPQIPFGKEIRFDREDIKTFLNSKKI